MVTLGCHCSDVCGVRHGGVCNQYLGAMVVYSTRRCRLEREIVCCVPPSSRCGG